MALLLDKVKFSGVRIGTGAITDWVRVAPYRLPTDIANVNEVVLLDCKLAGSDDVWERSWFTIGAGNALTIYKVVDTYLRSGPYTGTPPSAVNDFDGPVEVAGVADSLSLPVIGPDGFFSNGAAVNASLIYPDIKSIQARSDIANGQRFFAADGLHVNGGSDAGAGRAGMMLRYDSASGVAADYSSVYPMTSGLSGRLLHVPLRIPQKLGPLSIAAGGVSQVVNANRAGGVWKLEAWSDDDTDSYAECTVVGHATDAEIRASVELGDLEIVVSGTSVRIKNNGPSTAQFSGALEERH